MSIEAKVDSVLEKLDRIEQKLDRISPKVGVMETHVYNVERVARVFSGIPVFGRLWRSPSMIQLHSSN